MTIRKVDAYGASLGANTFTGAQVAPSLALGGATIGGNALAVTGTTVLGGSLLMGAATSITVAAGGIVGVGFALDQQAAGDISTKAAGRIGFSSTSNPSTAPDSAFSRIAAGIIGVGTGAAGNVAGGLQAATLALGGAALSGNVLAVTGTTLLTGGVAITGSLSVTDSIQAGNGDPLGWTSAAQMYSTTNGVILLSNNSALDFNRLQFGGTGATFPAIARSGTTLKFRTADDLNDAPITAATLALGDGAISAQSVVISDAGGFYRTAAGVTAYSVSSTARVALYSGGISLPSASTLAWSSGAVGTSNDSVFYRAGANAFGFSNSAQNTGFSLSGTTADTLTVRNLANSAAGALVAGAGTFSGALTVPGVTTAALTSTGTFTSGAAAQVGTLTNAPAAGNPTTWIKIIDNGVTRYIPAW